MSRRGRLLGIALLAACESKTPTPQPAAPVPVPSEHAAEASEPGVEAAAPYVEDQTRKSDYRVALQKGRSFAQAGEYPRALEQLRAALKASPDDRVALTEIGWVAFLAGDLSMAQEVSQRALDASESKKQRGMVLYNLARVAEARGEVDEALGLYRHSLRLRPHPTVEKRLAALESVPTSASDARGLARLGDRFNTPDRACAHLRRERGEDESGSCVWKRIAGEELDQPLATQWLWAGERDAVPPRLLIRGSEGWTAFGFDPAAKLDLRTKETRVEHLSIKAGSKGLERDASLIMLEASWPAVDRPPLKGEDGKLTPQRYEGELSIMCIALGEGELLRCSAPFVDHAQLSEEASTRYVHRVEMTGDLVSRLEAGSAPNVVGPEPRWLSPGSRRVEELVGFVRHLESQ